MLHFIDHYLYFCPFSIQGRIQDFKLGGAHLKKLRRAEGGAKIFGVFRVKNHDFTPKNHIISNCGGRRENFGVFRVKNHDFTPKNHIFSNFRGGARRGRAPGAPPLNPPLLLTTILSVLLRLTASEYTFVIFNCFLIVCTIKWIDYTISWIMISFHLKVLYFIWSTFITKSVKIVREFSETIEQFLLLI